MPRSIRTVILLLTLALLPLATTSAFAQTKKEPPPDYFPLRANDWWKYRSTTGAGQQSEFTMKVANVEKTPDGARYLVNIESSWPIQEWYSKPDGWVVWHKENYQKQNQEVSFSPARQYLKNPLTAGATWSWKGKGMMGVDIDESSTVAGPEQVVVPAGKFTAMKVTTRMTQGGTPVTKTYWYANWVGLVKSMTDTGSVQSTTELVDYSFKKP
jgi:hypothetical protein